jgi:sugar/nucleoside kinase (ribokinase family)
MGPQYVMLKKGEHGSVLITPGKKFFSAIYPVAETVDPTGAGDTFAGGFMGYIGMEGEIGWNTLKRAVVYGSASASFAVEDFSIDRLKNLKRADIQRRVKVIREMTAF